MDLESCCEVKKVCLPSPEKNILLDFSLGKKAGRRGSKKIDDHLSKMCSTPVSLKFGVVACKQGLAFI